MLACRRLAALMEIKAGVRAGRIVWFRAPPSRRRPVQRTFFLLANIVMLLALGLPVGAQEQSRTAALASAYDEMVAAQAALERADEARRSGIEPLPGERLGTASASGEQRSRLSDEYWGRQRRLEKDFEEARRRLDEATTRWNDLR